MNKETQMFTPEVWLNINSACNLSCHWCYAQKAKDQMSAEDARKYLHILRQIGVKKVILLGGEPTIHPQLMEILSVASTEGVSCSLITNGIRLADDKFLYELLSCNVSPIVVSLKASGRKLFISETGSDQFDQMVAGAKNVVDSGVLHSFNLVSTPALMKEGGLEEMLDLIRHKIGSRRIAIDSCRPAIVNERFNPETLIPMKKLVDFMEKAYYMLKEAGMEFVFQLPLPFCLFPAVFIKGLLDEGVVSNGCMLTGPNGISVSPKGDLLPCNHFCEFSLGKIEESFIDRKSYMAFTKREDIQGLFTRTSTCPHEQCVDCAYWQQCGGGCRIYWLCYKPADLIGSF